MWTLRGLVLLGLLAASYQRSRPTHYENTFATGDELELRVYLSEQLRFKDFNNSAALIWHATGMRYDMSSAGDIETTVQVNVTQHMLNNGSMYCHSFFTKAGKSPDPKALGSYDRWSSTHTIMSMVAHAERLKPIGLYNLLTGEPAPWETALRNAADEAAAAGVPEGQFIPYWKPKMHLQLVVDATPFPMDAMPNLMHNALHQSGLMQGHRYRPFVYVNELTVMKAHWYTLTLNLHPDPDPHHSPFALTLTLTATLTPPTLTLTTDPKPHPTQGGRQRHRSDSAPRDLRQAPQGRALPVDGQPQALLRHAGGAARHQREGERGAPRHVRAHQPRAALHHGARRLPHVACLQPHAVPAATLTRLQLQPHAMRLPTPCAYQVAVSAFHLLFDCLAFKSDLSFWNSVDTMEGLSSRTVLLNQVSEGEPAPALLHHYA